VRAWDTYDTYLFDIDGTLLHCEDAVHYFAFCEALTSIAGRPLNLDGVVTQGNVDIGILRDAFTLAHVPEAAWRPHLAAIRDALCAYVEAHASEFRITVLPAVPQVLAHLRARNATIGLATGNLERIGWAKLRNCNLQRYFDFGGFSDLYENRTQVFAGALARAKALNPSAKICVLGDTPADILAARSNGLDVIATATGTYSYEALAAAKPTRLVRSLEDLLT
jgi:phosphoglycolate phosphatase